MINTIPTYLKDAFVKGFTVEGKGQSLNAHGRKSFGDVDVDAAWQIQQNRYWEIKGVAAKIRAFESYLIATGANRVQSQQSESRYYYYEGVKYRFSAHYYPTGSMTSNGSNGGCKVVDLCADPHLINDVKF